MLFRFFIRGQQLYFVMIRGVAFVALGIFALILGGFSSLVLAAVGVVLLLLGAASVIIAVSVRRTGLGWSERVQPPTSP